MFGRLQAGAQNFTTGGNPIAGLLNAVQGLTTGTRTDPTGIALAQQQYRKCNIQTSCHGREDGAFTGRHRRPDAGFATRPNERIFQTASHSGSSSRKKCIRRTGRWWNTVCIGLQAASTRAKTMAQEQAKNAVQFPDIAANADNMISMIDQLKAHPGKDWLRVGPGKGAGYRRSPS